MAELGVFQGSSAQIICEAKKSRPLYLFDTFAGMPDPGPNETDFLKKGQFAAGLPRVKNLLRGYDNVTFCPGEFPKSAASLPPARFSFVHLDADLYSSTLAGLEYFYPRMLPGGIIITHDYSTLPGVARACRRICNRKARRFDHRIAHHASDDRSAGLLEASRPRTIGVMSQFARFLALIAILVLAVTSPRCRAGHGEQIA